MIASYKWSFIFQYFLPQIKEFTHVSKVRWCVNTSENMIKRMKLCIAPNSNTTEKMYYNIICVLEHSLKYFGYDFTEQISFPIIFLSVWETQWVLFFWIVSRSVAGGFASRWQKDSGSTSESPCGVSAGQKICLLQVAFHTFGKYCYKTSSKLAKVTQLHLRNIYSLPSKNPIAKVLCILDIETSSSGGLW